MREKLREALQAYQPQPFPDPTGTMWPAAVLILIYEHESRLHIVFQKRTDRVDTHKGEISFPGGGRDPEDESLLLTALRETHEEIGVHPSHVDVLGQVDEMRTRTNFHVTPFVGWLSHYPYGWTFSDHEVAYLLETPIDHLLDPANYVEDERELEGRRVILPSYRFGEDLIFGATARMLTNFLDIYRTLE